MRRDTPREPAQGIGGTYGLETGRQGPFIEGQDRPEDEGDKTTQESS